MATNLLPYEVVHCSSWDDNYNPEQLMETPYNESSFDNYKGWQTPKCPEYPQDLIIHLLTGPAYINKVQVLSHHFKIATKIDVYVGILKDPQDVLEDIVVPDTSDEDDNMLIEFTRLGYVCFDNNARAQFRARELKSIKINMEGEYVRLVIRNCHRNRLNTYNQVGILAIKVLGQPIHSASHPSSSIPPRNIHHPFDENSLLSSSTRRTSVSSNQSIIQKYPSTTNIVEIELQQWATVLLAAEEEAVQNEAYQEAKTYKYLGDKMQKFTKILADLEIGKRHAVETKDYDEAEKIKDDIKIVKQTAESLLKQANIQITSEGRLVQLEPTQNIFQDDDEKYHDFDGTLIGCEPSQTQPQQQHRQEEDWMVPDDDDIMSINTAIVPTQVEEPVDPESIPEPIMDEERGPYTLPIQIFGEEVVACILSIKSKCRGRGLGQLEQRIESAYQLVRNNQLGELYIMFTPDYDLADETTMVADFVNASLMLIQETVMDSREAIVTLAISIWHQLNDFCQQAVIDTEKVIEWVERAFCGLLKRTGDAHQKTRQDATSLILVLVQSYSTSPYTLLPLYIGKPERLIHNHKEAKARIELVETTVLKLGIDTPNKTTSNKKTTKKALVPLHDLMQFVVAYLGHSHDEVREAAVKLVVTISDQVGFNLVSSYIDESLKLSLADTVKKLVDKDSFNNTKFTKNDTKKTISELRALTVTERRTPTQRTVTSVKRSAANDTKSTAADKKRPASSAAKKQQQQPIPERTKEKPKEQPDQQEVPTLNENSVCIFCDEVNPEFNEDTLIKHYYNSCPVLTNCPTCRMITEISTLNEHMLVDCEKRHLTKECTRCHLAIPVEQWLQHTLKQTCPNVVDPSTTAICPLCTVVIEPPNESGWKLHLMTGDGCPKLKKSRSPKKQQPQPQPQPQQQQQQQQTRRKVTKTAIKK
ncbi:unnamed protein product [Rhizopus microsporus]